MELLANDGYRQTIFADANLSTVVHELGHIALHEMGKQLAIGNYLG